MNEHSISDPSVYSALAAALPSWYAGAARDLPWRRDRDPYRVWISEIMLQQTRVEAVRGYYARFLEALPDVRALAEADGETLMKLWEGLGYYSRARNLQKAARVILEKHGGVFPREFEAIRALPGVGEYTAGAIGSICFGLPTPAVDGNVLRVCARVTGSRDCVDLPKVKAAVRDALARVYPRRDCCTFTQALMELGATVCTPRAMRCELCPMRGNCRAFAEGTAASLPVRAEKKAKRVQKRTVFLFYCAQTLALEKRPETGLLAGLWQLPNEEGTLSMDEAFARAEALGLRPLRPLWTKERVHIFTHIRWEMTGHAIACAFPGGDFVWADRETLKGQYALPTAFRVFLD
ncbi:MAG: A/G-specific adenine glycosylase [Oscillospiraceae bacterium]|nr:A/G-specific adenine glycosylase [Oscillospiraceae bacterium]